MTSSVVLRPVAKENWRICIGLRVWGGQEDFVGPNVYALAEAAADPCVKPLVIYTNAVRGRAVGPEDTMVGLGVYRIEHGAGIITRLMIDRDHQRKGYGKAAVQAIIKRLKCHPEVDTIGASFAHENAAAERLYRSFGFHQELRRTDTEITLFMD